MPEGFQKAQNNPGESTMARQETRKDKLPPWMHFTIISMAVFVFFGIHNVLQEAMMKVPGFQNAVMLGYFEVLGVTICSYIERVCFRKETGRIAPLKDYTFLTICLLSSSGPSNMSLSYINFPTKVVFRSCKLIPTMVLATLINKHVFSSVEYVCAIAMCVGLVLFASADWKLTPTFNPIGLVLVSLSVLADAVLPNAQERLFKHGSSRLEVTLYSNIFTLIAMTCTTLASGDLVGVILHAIRDRQLAFYICIYIPVAYMAISAFMTIVKRYGAVTGVLIGMARKAMTLYLSFLLFPKAFSWYYVFGSVLVLGSLLVISLYKQKHLLGGVVKSLEKKSSEIELGMMSSNPNLDEDKDTSRLVTKN